MSISRSGASDRLGASEPSASCFSEVQHFRQIWLWVVLLGLVLPAGVWFGIAVLRQLLTGEPFGSHPTINLILGGLSLSAAMLIIGIFWFLYKFCLTTRVLPDEILVGFFTQRPLRIKLAEIRSCELCTFRPIRDYGGWGNRRGRHGRAMTVSGNRGVKLELVDGNRLLIGSQQGEALHAAIERQRGSLD